jgi:hypothetical protein
MSRRDKAFCGGEANSRSDGYGFEGETPMTVSGILEIWIALNAALAVALLNRRDRPAARAKLLDWVLKGERQPPRSARSKPEHQGR